MHTKFVLDGPLSFTEVTVRHSVHTETSDVCDCPIFLAKNLDVFTRIFVFLMLKVVKVLMYDRLISVLASSA
jgi:hypothetical protein